ncbi:MAG TPA: hypothetical protein VH161_05390, partial [Candidatus Acidoferrales bacterium]|nr:hypothetical protein [Candidatus Acidoferrales bacterium]
MSEQLVSREESTPTEIVAKHAEARVIRMAPAAPEDEAVSLVEVWRILRKRRWVIAAATCGLFALTMLYTLSSA